MHNSKCIHGYTVASSIRSLPSSTVDLLSISLPEMYCSATKHPRANLNIHEQNRINKRYFLIVVYHILC